MQSILIHWYNIAPDSFISWHCVPTSCKTLFRKFAFARRPFKRRRFLSFLLVVYHITLTIEQLGAISTRYIIGCTSAVQYTLSLSSLFQHLALTETDFKLSWQWKSISDVSKICVCNTVRKLPEFGKSLPRNLRRKTKMYKSSVNVCRTSVNTKILKLNSLIYTQEVCLSVR